MSVHMRDVGTVALIDGQWVECWIPCAEGDPGAVEFSPISEGELTELREEVEIVRRERNLFFDAICWALGVASDGFAERQEGQGAYWWRSELRRRAFPHGLPFASQHWKDRQAGVPEPEWVRD